MPSELTVAVPPSLPADAAAPPAPRRPRRVPLLAAALVAAWLGPLAAHAAHADRLLPPIVLLVTASLLRGGRTLLDRLVLALALLLGAATAAGLLFTTWPWGIRPVPVTGLALTLLALAAAATRRRPRLPRPGWPDLFPVAGTAAAVTYLGQPWLRAADLADQLTIMGRGEDNWRHLALFDAIGRLGGYAFVDPAGARDQVITQLVYYPQGWHLVTALLDGFLGPTGAGPRGAAGIGHYAGWCLASFGLLVLALLWAAHRVAGPLHPLHRTVLTVIVGSLVLGTQLPRLIIAGYPTEVFGLALTVLLAALVARPLAGTREQALLLGALLAAIGFSYYLFLPCAAVLALCWLVGHWREALRRWISVTVTGLAAATLALVAPLLGVLRAGQAEALTIGAGQVTEAWRALVWLGGIVAVALLVQIRRADRTWRRLLLVCVVGAALPLAIAQVDTSADVPPGYYFNKAAHLATALLIVGAAGVVRLLPVPPGGRRARGVAGTVAAVLAGAVTATTAVALCGVTGWHPSLLLVDRKTWAQQWIHQDLTLPSRVAWVCAEARRRYPDLPGTTTIVLDRGPYRGYVESLCLSTLQGTTARTEAGIYGLPFAAPDRTELVARRVPGPIRFVAADPSAERRLARLLKADPLLRHRVSVVTVAVPECDVLPSDPPPATPRPAGPPATPAPAVPACPLPR
ncbi:hypothetical protein ACFY3U_13020 [Micromonospora sp. NPDC000089]|uniref:hypothetical protein n=1 Tax=unclassified Micromonospora TaxID=2617518 RepID=UPI003684BE88